MLLLLRRAALLAGIAMLLFFVVGCGAYLATNYAALRDWYVSLNPCFYRAADWTTDFFSPATKRAGNGWAVGGLLVSVLWGISLYHRRKVLWAAGGNFPKRLPEWPVLLCFWVGGVALWIWGNGQVPPASDEVFSYGNVARLPLFQAWSYYMLPNNHVGFNVLNNLLQRAFPFGLLSGRLISLGAYLGTITIVFYWLRNVVSPKLLRYLILAVLATQSMTLLFAFQARGYAIYTVAAWLAFALTHRLLAGGNQRFFSFFVPAVIGGYAVLPSFLYVHGALILWVAIAQLRGRKDLLVFWRAQLLIAGGVFLFYLPVLLFSGLPSLAQNKWVQGNSTGFTHFLKEAVPTGQYYVFNEFAGTTGTALWSAVIGIVFLLPLLLAPFGKGKNRLLTLFFICLWGAFIGCALLMKQLPPGRSLSPLFSISLALSLIAVAQIFASVFPSRRCMRFALAALLPVALLGKNMFLNPPRMQTAMYGPDVALWHVQATTFLQAVPKDAMVGFGDEGFYFRYLWEAAGRNASGCIKGEEAYLLLGTGEVLPAAIGEYQKQGELNDVARYRRQTAGELKK